MPGPVAAVLALLAPSRCVACGERGEPPWCVSCEDDARALRPADPCPACGGARAGGGTAHRGCWRGEPPVHRLDAAYSYRGPVADAVVGAKVRGEWMCLEPLGVRIAGAVTGDGAVDAVCWVPTEPGRCRRRGFDHARLLADGVASVLGLPLVAALRCRSGSPDQGRRRLTDRAVLPADVFRPVGPLDGARLLLIDDVVTTGATVSRAARALTGAGASLVRAAVLARAGRHPLGALPHRAGC